MKTIQFKVTLLSDVIINQRAATEGNQKTLDFIPGNAFLGIAAGELYQDKSDESFTLFHSGKVRFGDAHPLVDEKRALKVPASWYKKKDNKEDNELYIHHGMPKEGLKDKSENPVQVKQYRDDFIVSSGGNKVSKVEIQKYFAIKSAYNSEKRRSEDAKMYGYESLQAGSVWWFEVVLDDDLNTDLELELIKALEGKKRIGRSSTAQYGLVEIEEIDKIEGIEKKYGFSKWKNPKAREVKENVTFVYAESRLVFFDKYGQPTFTPEAEQLGFPGGEICWNKSQIRTFQYAPFNNKRQTRDADRMGIEKGSVFCITGLSSSETETEKWVGSYQNEGFGKVLINPEFLEFTGGKGEAKFSFTKEKEKSKSNVLARPKVKTNDQSVLNYLNHQKLQKEYQNLIYEKVNTFVKENEKNFKGDRFASQWGTIRSVATQIKTKNFGLTVQAQKELLLKKLFEEKDDPKTKQKVSVGYLKHGVAKEKWEGYKVDNLEKFIRNLKPELTIETVINLAAEMAKKCRRD